MNHRILRRPRTFAIAVECSAMQGHAKLRCYVFVYSSSPILVGARGAVGRARSAQELNTRLSCERLAVIFLAMSSFVSFAACMPPQAIQLGRLNQPCKRGRFAPPR